MKRFQGRIAALTVILLCTVGLPVHAVELNVKPNRCITLHQGQLCYQKLNFQWQTAGTTQYCLYRADLDGPLLCWEGDDMQQFRYTFESPQGTDFYLVNEDSGEELARITIAVAWVYKSGKKVSTGWRLF